MDVTVTTEASGTRTYRHVKNLFHVKDGILQFDYLESGEWKIFRTEAIYVRQFAVSAVER